VASEVQKITALFVFVTIDLITLCGDLIVGLRRIIQRWRSNNSLRTKDLKKMTKKILIQIA